MSEILYHKAGAPFKEYSRRQAGRTSTGMSFTSDDE
jgi:hypothetical protein